MVKKKQQTEKKNRGLCRRIFKWIGLGLLSLLIIAATFFHAPWKVITLLLIILAACTALPKPARKWFWLSAAVVVIALIIWVFLPDDNEGWRPYTFDEELAALEAKYAIPDEENAAMIYNKLFEDFDIDSNQPKFFIRLYPSSINEPWLSKDHPETAEWLKSKQKTIEAVIETSRIEKCKFPIPVEPANLAQDLRRLHTMRSCAGLLVSSANNDIADGRIDVGIEKYLCVLRMAKHLRQQQSWWDHGLNIGFEYIVLLPLNRFVIEGKPSSEQLLLIANCFDDLKNNWCSDFCKYLEFDKLYYANTFGYFYETNSKGQVRLSRNPAEAIRTQFPNLRLIRRYFRRKPNKAYGILAWFFLPSTPQGAARRICAVYDQCSAMAEPDFDWDKDPDELSPPVKLNCGFIIDSLATISEERYYRIHDAYLKNLALRRGSRLLTAIKQYNIEHGSWPESLDAIKSDASPEAVIDPVTGGQLEYENHGKYFSLYGETINIWPK